MTVLLVEDDALIRMDLAGILADEGYEVVTAVHGADALQRLRQGLLPHVILLDLMMPVMNGVAFREAQLADPGLAHIPVVLLTGVADAQRVADPFVGVEIVAKPIRIDDLLAHVARHVA